MTRDRTNGPLGTTGAATGGEAAQPMALVVDDDALIRKILSDGLSAHFRVVTAESPDEALAVLESEHVHLIVADQTLPGITGIELLERTLRVRPDAVRVLVTASESVQVAMEAVNRARVDRYYVKPVPLESLLAEALRALGKRQFAGTLESHLARVREGADSRPGRILVVDDDEGAAIVVVEVLSDAGHEVELETTGGAAVDRLGAKEFDLLVLDKNLPDITGLEVMRLAKKMYPDVEALMITGYASTDSVIEAMEAGAYEYLRKPLQDIMQLPRTVGRALERRRMNIERQRLLVDLFDVNQTLSVTNESLLAAQSHLRAKMDELELLQDATVMGLTRLAEYRDLETGEHLERMRSYSRLIADQIVGRAEFPEVDEAFVDAVFRAAPLHDIGKVGIPDRILQKPGSLTPEEWEVMRTHPVIGGQTLEEAERSSGSEGRSNLLRIGKHIAYHHHEQWDGSGYPKGLAGEDIPLEARIVTVADAYDAITSRRVYKPSIPHVTARKILLAARDKHFDARLVDAFLEREEDILAIRKKHGADELVDDGPGAVGTAET